MAQYGVEGSQYLSVNDSCTLFFLLILLILIFFVWHGFYCAKIKPFLL